MAQRYIGRLSDNDYIALGELLMSLGFVDRGGAIDERPANGDFFRALVRAEESGNVEIASDRLTATITINLPK